MVNSASKRPKSQAQNNGHGSQQRCSSGSQGGGNGQELTAAFSRPELAVLEAFFTDTLTDLGDGDMN